NASKIGEVAVPHLHAGERELHRMRRLVPIAVVVKKEKSLVMPDRTTDVASKLIEVSRRTRLPRGVQQEAIGVKDCVLDVLIGKARERIRASLRYQRDGGMTRVFGAHVATLHIEFLNGAWRRQYQQAHSLNRDAATIARVIDLHTIQRVVHTAPVASSTDLRVCRVA